MPTGSPSPNRSARSLPSQSCAASGPAVSTAPPAAARAELRERVDALSDKPGERRQFVEWVLRRLLQFGPRVREGQTVPDISTSPSRSTPPCSAPTSRSSAQPRPTDPRAAPASLSPSGPPVPTSLRTSAGEHWAASPIDRMAAHCRSAGVELGLVTDGDRFTLVWAPKTGPIGRATWTATVFAEAAERTLLDSFTSVVAAKRFFAVAADGQLEALLAESASAQAEVTDQLGYQVRRAVELLVAACSRGNRERGGALLAGLDPHYVYEAACTVMMRLVFLLYAEERRLLPLGDELYDRYYAGPPLRQLLRDTADDIGNEETLEHRHTPGRACSPPFARSTAVSTRRAAHPRLRRPPLRPRPLPVPRRPPRRRVVAYPPVDPATRR